MLHWIDAGHGEELPLQRGTGVAAYALHRASGRHPRSAGGGVAVSADGRQALGLNYARMSLQIDFAHRISTLRGSMPTAS